jgi:hypothetical protein
MLGSLFYPASSSNDQIAWLLSSAHVMDSPPLSAEKKESNIVVNMLHIINIHMYFWK